MGRAAPNRSAAQQWRHSAAGSVDVPTGVAAVDTNSPRAAAENYKAWKEAQSIQREAMAERMAMQVRPYG